jgi:hypothetical protein
MLRMPAAPLFGLLLAALLAQSCATPPPPSATERAVASNFGDRAEGAPPKWSYDAGPDPKDAMGRELIDLNSSIPFYPGLSDSMMGSQKFRPAFGPIPWRMLQKPNSVKILFIGQDGTHIAEAAGRPATAGFGGRAQDLAKYFGVSWSAAFINTYAFTIKGQYGAFDAPMLRTQADGTQSVSNGQLIENPLWLMSMDPQSPLTQWRNGLIDWIIRNNKDSLQMIVLFGGAARDAAAVFVESHGGHVGTRTKPEELARIQVPETRMESTGGNNESPIPLSATGEDLYAKALGRKVNYTKPDDLLAAQKALAAAFKADPVAWKKLLVIPRGGVQGSGVLHPGQLGGFDIARQMEVNGAKGLSIKGLKLSDGSVIDHDVLVAQFPHPSALSKMEAAEAAQKVGDALKAFKPYVDSGWKIAADAGFSNDFAAGKPYKYGRADMGPEYYDFGAPASRMVAVSTASRLNANTIVFGTRDRATFDPALVKTMTEAQPSNLPDAQEMWTARPRMSSSRYVFDAGPGEKYARIMKENLPESLIAKFPDNRDFAHYRGTFRQPRVLIVADPDGYDDLITARALTGSRGQALHGLMEDLGVADRYLVLKTAPFAMDETRSAEWQDILAQTQAYREAVLKAVLAEGTPELVLADGAFAQAELARIFAGKLPCPVIHVDRQAGQPTFGMLEASARIAAQVPGFAGKSATGRLADIPRTHLSYYARVWEGTSGDRVITSSDPKFRGSAFAEVAPRWAYSQKTSMSSSELQGLEQLGSRLKQNGLRLGGEPVDAYAKRLQQ